MEYFLPLGLHWFERTVFGPLHYIKRLYRYCEYKIWNSEDPAVRTNKWTIILPCVMGLLLASMICFWLIAEENCIETQVETEDKHSALTESSLPVADGGGIKMLKIQNQRV